VLINSAAASASRISAAAIRSIHHRVFFSASTLATL